MNLKDMLKNADTGYDADEDNILPAEATPEAPGETRDIQAERDEKALERAERSAERVAAERAAEAAAEAAIDTAEIAPETESRSEEIPAEVQAERDEKARERAERSAERVAAEREAAREAGVAEAAADAPATAREEHITERDARIAERAAQREEREQNAREREVRAERNARERAERSAARVADAALAEEKREAADHAEMTARLQRRAVAMQADHDLAMDVAREAAIKAARSGHPRDAEAADQARDAEIEAFHTARAIRAHAQDAEREARSRAFDASAQADDPQEREAFEAARAAERAEQAEARKAHEQDVIDQRKQTAEAVRAIKDGHDDPDLYGHAPAEADDAPRDQSAQAKLAALKAEMQQRGASSPMAPAGQPAVGADAQTRAEILQRQAARQESNPDQPASAAELGRARQAAAIARTEADLEEQQQQRTAKAAKEEAAKALTDAEEIEKEAQARTEEARQEVYKVINEVSQKARDRGLPDDAALEAWIDEAFAKLAATDEGPEATEGQPQAHPEISAEVRQVMHAFLQSRAAASQLRVTLEEIEGEGGGYGQQQSAKERLIPVGTQIRDLFIELGELAVEPDAEKLQDLADRVEALTDSLQEQNAIERQAFGLGPQQAAEVRREAPADPDMPVSAEAIALVQHMIARSVAEGVPTARQTEEWLEERGISLTEDEPSLEPKDGSSPSILPQSAWLMREFLRVRRDTEIMIQALDAAGKAQPNMADGFARLRDGITRRRDAIGLDLARAVGQPNPTGIASVQTRLARFEAGAADMMEQMMAGLPAEAARVAAGPNPSPAPAPHAVGEAKPFDGTDAERLDDEIGVEGKGMITNGDPEPPRPSKLVPSKAGDKFSDAPGDVVPPRPNNWPIVMHWPPHRYMQALASPDVTPEKRQEFWKHLEEQREPMMDRANQIDEWIRSHRNSWRLRDLNKDDRKARNRSIGDPYRGVRWALLLENKPIKADGVELWGHSRAYTADGGVVSASHTGIKVRRVSDQAVKLAMQESLARGYGSLKISGTKDFCMKAAELARAAGVEAEISYHGLLGIKRTIKVMPNVPDPIVVHEGTEAAAKTPGSPEFEGRQAVRQIEERANAAAMGQTLPEPAPSRSAPSDPRSNDLIDPEERDRLKRGEAPRPKSYAEAEEDGPSPFGS